MLVIQETYFILLPIVATAILGWVGKLLSEQKKEHTALKINQQQREKEIADGITLILRYMLKRYHTEYKYQDKISYAQYSDWLDIYGAYKALGGNSIADEWNEEIDELPKSHSVDELTLYGAILRDVNKNK